MQHQLEFLKLGQLAFSEMVEFEWDFQVLGEKKMESVDSDRKMAARSTYL